MRRGLLMVAGRLAAVVTTVVAVTAGAPATSATADPNSAVNVQPDRYHLLRNKQNGWCLDASDKGSVYALPCRPGHSYQIWDFDYGAPRNWTQQKTARCLWGSADRSVSTARWFCAEGAAWWANRATADPSEKMIYNLGTGMCLDSNDEYDGSTKKVFLSPCNADDRGQRWLLDPAG